MERMKASEKKSNKWDSPYVYGFASRWPFLVEIRRYTVSSSPAVPLGRSVGANSITLLYGVWTERGPG